MKKFYTLAAALLATGSMLAANPAAIKPEARNAMGRVDMSQEGLAMIRADEAYAQFVSDNDLDLPGMQKFSWTDGNGEVWTVAMYESGEWTDNFTGWDDAVLYAKVLCTLSNGKSGNQAKSISYVMFAPRYSMWDQANWASLFPGEAAAADKMLPLKYMMSNNSIMTANWPQGWCVPQASTTPNNFYIGQTSTTGGQKADALVIMNSNTPSDANGTPYFSATSSMGRANYNGVLCGPAKGSSLQMSNFDDETSSIDLAFKGTCTNAAGSTIWTYNYDFSGVAFMPGLCSAPQGFEATSVHVVNTGSVTGEDDAYINFTDQDWGPLQRFYLLACGDGYTYDQVQLAGGGNLWTATTIPTGPARMTEDASLNQIRGALFAPNAADPNGTYHTANVEVSIKQIAGINIGETEGTPGPYTTLYGGWNRSYWAWSETEGLEAISQGYRWWFPYDATANPYVTVAHDNKTFAVGGNTSLNCDFNITAQAGKKVIYHYDPSNYLLTREITGGVNSIFNDGENNFTVDANNGMINVNVANDALVNIYTTNGMLVKSVNAKAGQNVSVDAANGIYLVKVGGKTVKVAL